MSEKHRAYVYRILTAIAPILVFHGFVTDQAVSLYLALAGTVLGVGLASLHTSTLDENIEDH